MRGEAGFCGTTQGERFMSRYDDKPDSRRAMLSTIQFNDNRTRHAVFLDMTAMIEDFQKNPKIYEHTLIFEA